MPSHDHCCVPGCQNRRNKLPCVSFHAFPRTGPTRRSWIIAIKRDEGPKFKITESTVVCSEHFSPDNFTLPLGYGGGKVFCPPEIEAWRRTLGVFFFVVEEFP